MDIIDNLRAQGVDEKLIEDVMYFRNYYGLEKDLEYRVTKSKTYFYGKDILSMCIS
ncbi:TPA: MoxR family ATPase, partial [Clostridioides difficile]|nr:MoxR family ATPase [Clostridioides difficile]